jgi:hypothetical protein
MSIEKASVLEELFYELTDEKRPEPFISYCGDHGTGAGTSFAASLWLVDHAGVFLRAIKAAEETGKFLKTDNLVDLSERILVALSKEIGLPKDVKLKLISRLLVDIGISLQVNSYDWETASLQKFKDYAQQASLHFTGTGYELFLLPWAFEIESMESVLPLEKRISSLRESIPKGIRGLEISELELNNWAYFLLLVDHWKAATPMASIAVEMNRISRNLDTLGWAYFFEGDNRKSIELLSESLEKRDPEKNPESWAEVAYHKMHVLLHSGLKSDAEHLLESMKDLVPTAYWTERAKNLQPLFEIESQQGEEGGISRTNQIFEYDVALSFAGEDRLLAKQVAIQLERAGITVFYDEFEKAELWGKNLFTYLTDVYCNKARYCIIFMSRHYVAKAWTRLEREAAQSRAFRDNQEYILPIRIDRTEIPGILTTVGYLDWEKEGVEGIVNCLSNKLERY